MMFGLEQILTLLAIGGFLWSVVMYLPRTVLGIYKDIDSYRDNTLAEFGRIDNRITALENLIATKEVEIKHRLDLHIQQNSMCLDRMNEMLITMQKTLDALHRRLNESNSKRLQ